MEQSMTSQPPARHFGRPLQAADGDVEAITRNCSDEVKHGDHNFITDWNPQALVALFSNPRVDEPSSLEVVIAHGHEGLCTTYPEAAGETIPLAQAANSGFRANPNQGYYDKTQQNKSEPFQQGGISSREQVFKEAEKWPYVSLDEWFKEAEECTIANLDDPLDSAMKLIWKADDAIQRGIHDHTLHETTLSDHLLPDYFPMSDFQVPEVGDMLCDQDYGIRCGQYDQERRGRSDLESQLKLSQERYNGKLIGDPALQERRGRSDLESQLKLSQERYDGRLIGDPALQERRGRSDLESQLKLSQERYDGKLIGDPALQERRGRSDLESQLKLSQERYDGKLIVAPDLQERRESQLEFSQEGYDGGHSKELVSNMKKEIEKTIGEFDQGSFRRKLQDMKSDVVGISSRLKSTIQRFDVQWKRLSDDLERHLERATVANSGPQQELIRTNFQAIKEKVESFSFSALKKMRGDMDNISRKLDKLVDKLAAQELSEGKLFQNCASSISVQVDSFLGRQGSNYISVADFQ